MPPFFGTAGCSERQAAGLHCAVGGRVDVGEERDDRHDRLPDGMVGEVRTVLLVPADLPPPAGLRNRFELRRGYPFPEPLGDQGVLGASLYRLRLDEVSGVAVCVSLRAGS